MYGYKTKVFSTDSVKVGAQFHKRFLLGSPTSPGYVVEGVGHIGELFYLNLGQSHTQLLCFSNNRASYSLDTTQCFYIHKYGTPANISDKETENIVSLYPNPANGIVHLQIEEAAVVSIYSVDGKLVLSQQLVKRDNAINISSLHSGMYMVNVINDNQIQRTTLVKQ